MEVAFTLTLSLPLALFLSSCSTSDDPRSFGSCGESPPRYVVEDDGWRLLDGERALDSGFDYAGFDDTIVWSANYERGPSPSPDGGLVVTPVGVNVSVHETDRASIAAALVDITFEPSTIRGSDALVGLGPKSEQAAVVVSLEDGLTLAILGYDASTDELRQFAEDLRVDCS